MSVSTSMSEDVGIFGRCSGGGSESGGSEGTESTASVVKRKRSEFADDEAEEAEESEASSGDVNSAGSGVAAAVVRRACGQSFVSETDDDGFAAMAREWEELEANESPKKEEKPVKRKKAEPLRNPQLPSDPATLQMETTALEGHGAGQLRLEMRALEATGMKLLKESDELHDFLPWVRRLLAVHTAHHIKHCLHSRYGDKIRAVYLFDRLRRRYWARITSKASGGTGLDPRINEQLPLVTGEVVVTIPFEPSEAGLVGTDLSPEAKAAIGKRSAGAIVANQTLVKHGKGLKALDPTEQLVVVSAEAMGVNSTTVAAGVYGSYVGTVTLHALMVPVREGGTLTGVVTAIRQPLFNTSQSMSQPQGTAMVVVDAGGDYGTAAVAFGAEVPERAQSVGRVWVLKLQRTKDRKYRLAFALDVYLFGAGADSADVSAKTGEEVSRMNVNRKPSTLQQSKCWAAGTDKATGWRFLKQLPETGYWTPASLGDMFGSKIIRGYDVVVDSRRHHTAAHVAVCVSITEEQKKGRTAHVAAVSLHHCDYSFKTTVRTSSLKSSAQAAKELCTKVARCIEIVLFLRRSGVEPKEGSLCFVEGGVSFGVQAQQADEKESDDGMAKAPKKRKLHAE